MTQIQTVWAVYFSPTDGTKKITQRIAQTLGEIFQVPVKYRSFTLPEERQQKMVFGAEDAVVIGVPVYAGRVPNLIAPYISTIEGNGAWAAAVVTFGNRAFDNALAELCDSLKRNGFQTAAAAAFVCEHSFSRTLGGGRPNAEDLAMAEAFAAKAANCHAPLTGVPGDAAAQYFQPKDGAEKKIDIRKVKPKTSQACNECGLCAMVCPMGAIDRKDPKLVPGICIKCCACVKKCPKGAKYFDDAGFLFHKKDLEEKYERPASVSLYYGETEAGR